MIDSNRVSCISSNITEEIQIKKFLAADYWANLSIAK